MNRKRTQPPAKSRQDKAPPAGRTQQNVARHQVEATSFSGPLPHPDLLAEYDRLHPGFAERILVMAEKEQKHRHQQERHALDAEIRDIGEQSIEARRGQWFGFGIGAIAIIAGAITAVMGAEWSGGLIGSAGVVGLVTVFVFGRKGATK